MHRRLSTAEKGKAPILEHHPAPRTARIRLSAPDNSELLKKHALTLIGRVTNQSAQKVWSLIPFFIDHWKTDIAPVGSDLGSGMFQFQFELEADLIAVLDKRPYFYARWMVILERWEPTASPNFPSMIPFWIKIQGIPVHLWTEEAARRIGEDIGTFEAAEITPLSMRIRVHINGRLPLIKTTILEYDNGDEVTARLIYEKLDKHCLKCCRLDHDLRDCLEAKHEKKALRAAQEESLKTNAKVTENDRLTSKDRQLSRTQRSSDEDGGYKTRRNQPHSLSTQHQLSNFSTARRGHPNAYQRNRPNARQEWIPKEHRDHRDHSHHSDDFSSRNNGGHYRENPRTYRGDSHSSLSPKQHTHRSDNRVVEHTPLQRREVDISGGRSNHRHNNQSFNRGIPREERQHPTPRENSPGAVEKVRDAILQYANCADPTESAARRERLINAEEQGRLKETAALAVRTAIRRNSGDLSEEVDRSHSRNRLDCATDALVEENSPQIPSSERAHVTSRLGPLNCDTEGSHPNDVATERIRRPPISSRLGASEDDLPAVLTAAKPSTRTIKRKPGRPLGSKKSKDGAKDGAKKIPGSPALLLGTSSRKRKVQQTKQSNVRKKLQVDAEGVGKSTRGRSSRGTSSHGGSPHEDVPTNSENLPICNMIPPSRRNRMDFRIHSNPAP